jgi:hypothetical protein
MRGVASAETLGVSARVRAARTLSVSVYPVAIATARNAPRIAGGPRKRDLEEAATHADQDTDNDSADSLCDALEA